MTPKKSKVGIIEAFTRMSYSSLGLLWIGIAVFFAFAYFVLHMAAPLHGPSITHNGSIWTRLGNAVYFSVITGTTTGYGDIVPHGFSKLLSCIQSVLSFLVFGVFVTKLVSNRQELQMEHVYRMTAEDIFYNTREGLYIVRKDLDRLIDTIEENHTFSEQDWDDLITAYKQSESLFSQIPEFYEDKDRVYTIDERREELLEEAVQRTLNRISRLHDAMNNNGIDWKVNQTYASAIRTFHALAGSVIQAWKEYSPYNRPQAFDAIEKAYERIQAML